MSIDRFVSVPLQVTTGFSKRPSSVNCHFDLLSYFAPVETRSKITDVRFRAMIESIEDSLDSSGDFVAAGRTRTASPKGARHTRLFGFDLDLVDPCAGAD
jgi:hypothetical protein